MTVMAAWCMGLAFLFWAGRLEWAWIPWLATLGGAVTGPGWPVAVTGLMSGWLLMSERWRRRPSSQTLRLLLVRFWQQVAVLLTAGLTFWQAVEVSADTEPALTALLGQAAGAIAQQPHRPVDNPGLPGSDGEVTLMLLQHGYLHGLSAAQVRTEVGHMEARLRYEEEARKRRDPLWMTILPAFLLLNVLWVFVAPMIAMASHSWLHI